MAKYEVRVPWSGYSRGRDVYTVEADSIEEARQKVEEFCEFSSKETCVIRNDIEHDWGEAVVLDTSGD